MPQYHAIIFDLGKVIFDLSFDRTFQSWANASGKAFNEIQSRFLFDEIFDKFEKDEITSAQFRTKISQRLNLNITNKEFDEGWCDLYLDVYEGIDNLLIDLKKQYKLIALTNTNFIHFKVWKEKYADILKHFSKIFSSNEMKVRKPEQDGYQMVLDYLKTPAEKTIFLDDNHENIKGANKLGIKTFLVTSPQQMITDLYKLLNFYS